MPTRRIVCVAIAILLGATARGPGADGPMGNEDVVRMLVAGASTSKTVAAIRSRDVDFDLSEEMLDELRAAGVPDAVIDAMRNRQAELHPPPPPETLEGTARTELPLAVFRLVAADNAEKQQGDTARTLYFPGALPPPIAVALEVGDGSEAAEVESVAVFVACRTAYHVPDYWRSKSPLGRDFVSMPRHRMLVFLRSSERVPGSKLPPTVKGRFGEAARESDFLVLELPPTVESQLNPDEPHDLMVGVAVEVGGRFVRLVSDERDGLEVKADSAIELIVGNGDAGDGFGVVASFGSQAGQRG